jgi:hypothetical protein
VADTYGVTPADVAAELPGLFPGGFTATSVPSDTQVVALIAAADAAVTLRITDAVGNAPALSDKAAGLAKRYIIDWVKAQVLRIVYAGRDPFQVSAAAKPYDDLAASMLVSIDVLGSQATGTGESSPRVTTSLGTSTLPTRELLITDEDLDMDSGARSRF